ncbi:MAG: hypothetical protein DDT27_01647 [Dehalococcoidia bacterium]|nr:hypothetical protein [Chloroflexota bacterium]
MCPNGFPATMLHYPVSYPLKLKAQDSPGRVGHPHAVVDAPAYHPDNPLSSTDEWHAVPPETGDPGIHHEVLQLLRVIHAQWLEPVAITAASDNELCAGKIEIEASFV